MADEEAAPVAKKKPVKTGANAIKLVIFMVIVWSIITAENVSNRFMETFPTNNVLTN